MTKVAPSEPFAHQPATQCARTGSLRQQLIEHTRQIHEELHTHPRLVPLLGSTLTLSYYADLLVDYHAFYQRVETARRAAGWYPDLTLSWQLTALQRDLESLGNSKGESLVDISSLPSPSAALGGLYVLIGAQFGGHIIGTQIRSVLPEAPCHFFSRSPENIDQWRRLLSALEALPATGPLREETLFGAKTVFQDFARHLSSTTKPSCDTSGV